LGPFNYLKQKYPDAITAAGSIYVDTPSAALIYQDYKKAAQSVGYVFKYDRAFGPTETDFTSDVVRMRNDGVKLVYLLSVDDKTTARFAKAMQDQNFKPEVFAVNASGYDPDVIALGGSAVEGMLVTMSLALFDGEDAAVIPEVALMDKWVQTVKPGFKPDTYSAYAWSSGRLLFDAMARVGPKVTRAAVNTAIRQIGEYNDYGMLAPSNPGTKDPGTCFILARINGGKFARFDSPLADFRCNDGGYFFL
jgi:ABC-type branched-subunit amino acid transport system substrate-binding protein